MSKHLEVLEDLRYLNEEQLASLAGQLLTVAEDVAYAYDITEEMTERLKEVLDDHDVRSQIVDEEDIWRYKNEYNILSISLSY